MSVQLIRPAFSDTEVKRIGEKIFQNETSGNRLKLVFWNPKEDFPSMGICHFLWLPLDFKSAYLKDTFSEFLQYCNKKGIELPTWLQEHQKCPWVDRDQFVLEQNSPKVEILREFLANHKEIQTKFILKNFMKGLPAIIESLVQRDQAVDYCNLLLSMPTGCFALIDYNQFKGQGLGSYPEYNNQGWGLKQVLERALEKDWQKYPLEVFIESAKETLANRVENAPENKKEIEKSFIPGWNNRIDRYRFID